MSGRKRVNRLGRLLKRAKGHRDARWGDDDLFRVSKSLLDPRLQDRIRSVDTAWAVAPLLKSPEADWMTWLPRRYPTLFGRDSA